MRVILFGATGMVGQGVLRECLRDPGVTEVLAIVRTPLGVQDSKLRAVTHTDFLALEPLSAEMTGFDACFFCLGISSVGMAEPEYTRITYDYTMAAANVLARVSPQITFIYVSGESTDSTEQGRTMWARVKGRTENALLRLPFHAVALFRPGYIQPLHGIVSKTPLYRTIYALVAPLYPLLRRAVPDHVITTEEIGLAMLRVAREGGPTGVLHTREIAALARTER